MSDLISRSELIKELNKYCGNQRYLVSENIREIINNQPTAYDVDNIVQELEEAKHEICLSDDDLEHYQNGIDNAIEIVKAGVKNEID